jgi:hypothetical protein
MVTRAIDGELESELEYEHELEGEEEYEGEEFLGTIARGIGGLLGGQGEGEEESEYELEGEWESEHEGEYEGEEFFRRIARGVGGFVRRAAPVLRSVARVAAPIVGTAVGGPLGGVIGRAAGRLLREGELEGEWEGEWEGELEGEGEMELEGPISSQEALAEYMATVASRAATEAEAEAMVGAAAIATLSPADRAALRTRILRRRGVTRPVVRAVPTIVRRTARTLTQRAAAGQPVTRRTAARVMANQTRRVIGQPRQCAQALQRNARGTAAVARARTRPAGPAGRVRAAAR